MNWEPITAAEIEAEIRRGLEAMSAEQRNLWDVVKVRPEKWQLSPWGDEGGGFWIVAILGHTVIWYNDIEDGFNRSRWSKFGVIDEYQCNQDELQWIIGHILTEVQTGQPSDYALGPPEAV